MAGGGLGELVVQGGTRHNMVPTWTWQVSPSYVFRCCILTSKRLLAKINFAVSTDIQICRICRCCWTAGILMKPKPVARECTCWHTEEAKARACLSGLNLHLKQAHDSEVG
jgi:hypothetical protein